MRKAEVSIEDLHELHRSGQLEAAKKGYQTFLAQEPHNAEALHALGLIYVEEKKLSKAADTLNKAIRYQPDNPILQLHLANVLKMQGLFIHATEALQQTLTQYPDYAPAYNNLGTVYYAQGKLAEAVEAYQLALQKEPLYTDAHYNLALALSKLNQLDTALYHYQQVLQRAPEHAAARFQLACIYMQKENWELALNHFLEIEKNHPLHFETQINFATCYIKKGALDEAKLHYLKALELNPEDSQILFNLGHIHTQQGQIAEAIKDYEQILKRNPDDFSAHNNLGAIYSAQRQTELALHHFQEASRLEPSNAAISHIVKILKNDPKVILSPPEYLKSLFNYYADHYETHLLKVLDYRVPQILLQSFIQTQNSQKVKFDILDLGCGTGLCGSLFKPYAKSLVGVDLASQMLKLASAKNIYDQLFEEDLISFVSRQNAAFDLILAGDVLVYFGDLTLIFNPLRKTLKSKGLFIFNAEVSTKEAFSLNPSGRFIHHKAYIDKALQQSHFLPLYYDTLVTRLQDNKPVMSHIYIVQAN